MIGLFAVTESGRRAAADLAARLGPDAVIADGPLRPALQRMWPELGAAVFFLATGATVRLIAALLADKRTDPGVVCVDEAHRFAVALAGGHGGGANALAVEVADLLGATPVVTTASDATATTALDDLVELLDARVEGDLAACAVAVLDGEAVRLENPRGYPLPALPENVSESAVAANWSIVIDDRVLEHPPHGSYLRLIPRSLVVGIGSARGVGSSEVIELLATAAAEQRLDPKAFRAFASIDVKSAEGGIVSTVDDHAFWHDEADLPYLCYPADALATIAVPNPSEVVARAVGTPSVAEAAALHAASELSGVPVAHGVELVLAKRTSASATVAIARMRPRGRLALIGLGPGAAAQRTPQAEAELRRAAVVVGLDSYVDVVRHLLRPGTEVLASGLGAEEQRAEQAVSLARKGKAVALIGSGDAGVYAMASPALQQADQRIEVIGVPGVTAALAAAALLGAPLGHDHALISLSDLHTPWEVIERRVTAAGNGDFVVCFYNPRSRERDWQLDAALRILAAYRGPDTPVGAVRQASRVGQRVRCARLADFDAGSVDMLTTVIVGSSQTILVDGRMVTPRGYRWMPGERS
ncbi:MAG: precorrin-3B C(17)-methyltransferase [Sciscionella sp.]